MVNSNYILGHSNSELRRLALQAEILRPGTERILRAAGLRAGQSVLDVGTGLGDVALLAATLVGSSGSVRGIDLEEKVVELARRRTARSSLKNVTFEVTGLDGLSPEARFDVVLGRYVVHHQRDRVGFLKSAAQRVRPDGLLLFLEQELPEPDSCDCQSYPAAASFDMALKLFATAYKLKNVHMRTASEMTLLFYEAGLPQPNLFEDFPVYGPNGPIAEWLVLSLRSVLPILEDAGVASAETIGIDTLLERIKADARSAHSQLRFGKVLGGCATIAA